MKNPLEKNFGFTLIELLVVISIIGLLSSIVLTSVNSARVKARDATRIAEVRQLITALQFYYDDNNTFPPTPGCNSGWCCLGHGDAGRCWNGAYWGSTALDNALSPKYISKLPDVRSTIHRVMETLLCIIPHILHLRVRVRFCIGG